MTTYLRAFRNLDLDQLKIQLKNGNRCNSIKKNENMLSHFVTLNK